MIILHLIILVSHIKRNNMVANLSSLSKRFESKSLKWFQAAASSWKHKNVCKDLENDMQKYLKNMHITWNFFICTFTKQESFCCNKKLSFVQFDARIRWTGFFSQQSSQDGISWIRSHLSDYWEPLETSFVKSHVSHKTFHL